MQFQFTSTPIYSKPALRYPAVGGMDVNEIPMVITDYKGPSKTPKTGAITSIPYLNPSSNTVWHGQNPSFASLEITKINLTGFLQTPMITFTNISPPQEYPGIAFTSGSQVYYFMYADLIAMYMEGRATSNSLAWVRTDPDWFRDPFGRVFTKPRVIDFTASYVEAVPGRTTFTMVLQIV